MRATPNRFHIAGLLALLLLCGVTTAKTQQGPPSESSPPRLRQEGQAAPPQETEVPERLHLMVGRSLVITSPARLKRVSVADPNIADAITVSPNQILINGKSPGGVSLVLWDENDQSQTFDVMVDMDILGLSQKIREVFPEEPVKLEASKDVVMLSGRMSSKDIADKILQVVSATTPKVISLMEVPAPPPAGEVVLEVKFAEVNRAALSQFSFNFISLPGPTTRTAVTISTQQFAPPQLVDRGDVTSIGLTDLLNVFIFRPDIDLAATIRALQQKNLLQILAEPNLLTQIGKEASFLAGGEFPFPVVQAGLTGNAITIQFKEFGVRLNFTPTLAEDGKIHLKVRPEVSALDFANALSISGFLIPALSTRRVETEMDLGDGQSFAIAGLVDDRLTQIVQKIPILGDIPILGQLFRSRSLNKTKTELLVLVTPRIVKPLPPGQVPVGPQFPKPFLPPAMPEQQKPPAQR
ncbi:MAG TPA: type II and III secretion system protein family protein [Candidatus Acidoferrales bacterium]